MNKKRHQLIEEVIQSFLVDSEHYPTIASINEGGCGDFVDALNSKYEDEGLSPHQPLCTFDFISPTVDSGDCEYMDKWQETSMNAIGVPTDYFSVYKAKVKAFEPRGVVGYHVWLYDQKRNVHYDATCTGGVANPLDLPFFQQFTQAETYQNEMR